MADERIIELDTINEVPADGYLAIDTVTGDTYKILPIKIGAQYTIQDGEHSFTLVGSNGYSHTVDIPYDSVSMTQAEYNALTPAQKADGTARFITDAESDVESELWSKVGRQTLDTDAQVLSNAVNELKGDMTQAQSDISELNSSLLKCQQVQFVLPQTITINANSSGILLDRFDISTSTITDTIFTNKTLTQLFGGHTVLGVVGLWCSSGLIPLEAIVWANTNELTIRFYNHASGSITVTAIRLLVFYI